MFLYDRLMKKELPHQQLLYIDESNISVNTGHTVYACIFIMYLDKHDISDYIGNIERGLYMRPALWVNMSWKLRIKFAENIKNLNFSCKVVLYKNPVFQNVVLEDFFMKIIINNYSPFKVIIDGKKSDSYIHKLKSRLKYRGIAISKLLFVNDKGDPLVRLADFIAGLIRSYVDNRSANNEYMFDLLKHKIKMPD